MEVTALPTEPQPPPLATRKLQSNVKTNIWGEQTGTPNKEIRTETQEDKID